MEHFQLYIDGQFTDAADGAIFETFDPGTGSSIATVAKAGPAEAEAAVAAARRAFDSGTWSGMKPADRARKVMNFADHLGRKTLRLALMEAMDSGGVINRTRSEPSGRLGLYRGPGRPGACGGPFSWGAAGSAPRAGMWYYASPCYALQF